MAEQTDKDWNLGRIEEVVNIGGGGGWQWYSAE